MNDQAQELLDTYASSLRSRDLDATLACYTDEAVVQAPGFPDAHGAAVRAVYEQIFAALVLDIAFTVETTVEGDGGTLAVFTRSSGTQTDVTSGDTSPESNREAFVLQPVDGRLRISRYLFNVSG